MYTECCHDTVPSRAEHKPPNLSSSVALACAPAPQHTLSPLSTPTDSSRLRYAVAGLALGGWLSGAAGGRLLSSCFVVRVVRGVRAGECYLVGPQVIKSLMSGAMRRRAGCSLGCDPVAM